MYLLDTNALSLSGPAREPAPERWLSWLDENEGRCYLSALTLMELTYGVRWLRHREATQKAARLERWLEAVSTLYGDRIVAAGSDECRAAGTLMALARSLGHAPESADAIIAGTAKLHGWTVVTRNPRHFQPLGVSVLDPTAV